MNTFTKRGEIAGPAGALSVAVDTTTDLPSRGLAVICHPHPLQGGTMDNKVVTTLARALVQRGWRVARFDYRGVRQSAGSWDEGRGEVDDALAVVAAHRVAGGGGGGGCAGRGGGASGGGRAAGARRLLVRRLRRHGRRREAAARREGP